jgi:catechol 2,3-dioxygenase-like lactoylglutathione lyase family enzyme
MSPAREEILSTPTKAVKSASGPAYRPPISLAHIVLHTSPEHYRPMIDFYCKILKAEITCDGPLMCFLRYDYEHHRIAIVNEPKLTPVPEGVLHAGLDHIAFGYKTLTDLARTYVGLRDHPEGSLLPVWTTNHGPTTSLYYRDPDRNKIELQVDNFDFPEEANAFMGGPDYVDNPIGSDFDAEQWAAYVLGKAKEDGSEGLTEQDIKDLKKRPNVGIRHELPDGWY